MCARRSTSRATSAGRSCSACPTTCRSSRCRTSAPTSRRADILPRGRARAAKPASRSSSWSRSSPSAKCPIIIAGRGVDARRARRPTIEELAEASGALLATTLLGARHVRSQPVLARRRRRLCPRHRARGVRARPIWSSRSARASPTTPSTAAAVPQGRDGADRHRAARASRTARRRPTCT